MMVPKTVVSALFAVGSIMQRRQPTMNEGSIKDIAAGLAYSTMAYYTGNITKTPQTIAVLPKPYYWWEAGAMWGAMLDYTHYTGDQSYLATITEALVSQAGPAHDFMNPVHYDSTGNDDQAFWGFAVLAAAERNIPLPSSRLPSWLRMAENLWNSQARRWDMSRCGGGLSWQIFADNPHGLGYVNSISNGGFAQLSARLARATGNATYAVWAERVWRWSEDVGLLRPDGAIYDGADGTSNCSKLTRLTFTYTHGVYLYTAAVMSNYTAESPQLAGDSAKWAARAHRILNFTAERFFYSAPTSQSDANDSSSSSSNTRQSPVMWEQACEHVGTCNTDMKSFKGYLARYMWASARILPAELAEPVARLLAPSVAAAASACVGLPPAAVFDLIDAANAAAALQMQSQSPIGITAEHSKAAAAAPEPVKNAATVAASAAASFFARNRERPDTTSGSQPVAYHRRRSPTAASSPVSCGQKWYTGGYDGVTGLGQQMSALEVVQGLLAMQAAPPLRAGEIRDVRDHSADDSDNDNGSSDSFVPPPSQASPSVSALPRPAKREDGNEATNVPWQLLTICVVVGVVVVVVGVGALMCLRDARKQKCCTAQHAKQDEKDNII